VTEHGPRLHGEYKTPGGKLIAVDLRVAGNVLVDVQVSGDFFVYPEEAFADLAGSLEGAPVPGDEAALAERIRSGFRPGAHLLGSSPQALARAVARALASAGEDHDG